MVSFPETQNDPDSWEGFIHSDCQHWEVATSLPWERGCVGWEKEENLDICTL